MNAALDGKVAFVTGASRGIGEAIAIALARNGVHVALGARHKEPAMEVVKKIQDEGGKATAFSVDVADAASVKAAAKDMAEVLGKVTILVNNAGVTRDQLLMRMKEEDWRSVMDTNLGGAFNCTKVFSRDMMRARWGRIINISSIIGTLGNAGQANYAASKAGLNGFTKSMARELASRNITVNAVAPGFIETAMTEKLDETVRVGMLESIPLSRFGSPEDVANLVVFLAGEGAEYITGQVIHIDGGMVMA